MRRAIVGIAVIAMAVALLASPPKDTLAEWTDSEASSGSFTAATTVGPPISLSCSISGGRVTFSWGAPNAAGTATPTGYDWTLVNTLLLGPNDSGSVTGTSVQLPSYGIALGTSRFTVKSNAGGWVSSTGPTGTYSVVQVALSLVLGCSVP